MTKLLEIDRLVASETNPREEFDAGRLEELAGSIRRRVRKGLPGIHTPLRVREVTDPLPKGVTWPLYELIAGHRRLRAAKKAGLKAVPCIVESLPGKEMRLEQLLDNLHREDLKGWELGKVYRGLIDGGEFTVESLAKEINKERAHVFAMMQAAKLEGPVREAMEAGEVGVNAALKLAAGFKKAGIDEKEQRARVKEVKGKSYREVEGFVKGLGGGKDVPPAKSNGKASEGCFFVVARDGMGTFLSPGGGWTNEAIKGKRFGTVEEAMGCSWMAGGGHSVVKVWAATGQWQRVLQENTASTVVTRSAQALVELLRKAGALDDEARRWLRELRDMIGVALAKTAKVEAKHGVLRTSAGADRSERRSLPKAAKMAEVKIAVRDVVRGPRKANAYGVFEEVERVIFTVPGFKDLHAEVQMAMERTSAGKEVWRSSQSFQIDGTGVGCGGWSGPCSKQGERYGSRGEALAAEFQDLLKRIAADGKHGRMQDRLARYVAALAGAKLEEVDRLVGIALGNRARIEELEPKGAETIADSGKRIADSGEGKFEGLKGSFAANGPTKRDGAYPMTAEARRRIAEAQRKRWAAARAGTTSGARTAGAGEVRL